MSEIQEPPLAEIEEANARFEEECVRRHQMGAEKYGDNTYVDKDTLAMMQDELVDFANYARYTFIKLELMRQGVRDWSGEEVAVPRSGMEMLGKAAVFQPAAPKRGEQ